MAPPFWHTALDKPIIMDGNKRNPGAFGHFGAMASHWHHRIGSDWYIDSMGGNTCPFRSEHCPRNCESRQTDRHRRTDIQTDRQADRQIHICRHTHAHSFTHARHMPPDTQPSPSPVHTPLTCRHTIPHQQTQYVTHTHCIAPSWPNPSSTHPPPPVPYGTPFH